MTNGLHNLFIYLFIFCILTLYKNKLSWNITNKEIKNIRKRKYKQFTTYPTPPPPASVLL